MPPAPASSTSNRLKPTFATCSAWAGGILATWGGGKVAGKIGQIRSQRDEYGQKLDETFEALRQIVRGVDNLDDETRAKVKQAQAAVQDAATQMLVAEARRT